MKYSKQINNERHIDMNIPPAPKGYNTVNSFIITKNARKFIDFTKHVFEAEERKEAFTTDTDGLVLHAEIEIGNSVILCVDTKEGWPVTPAFIQVYVEDVDKVLARAESMGGEIITKPTDFYGDTFSRMLDPHGNLWWIYQHNEEMAWEASDNLESEGEASDWDTSSDGLNYIHETIMEVMPKLGRHK